MKISWLKHKKGLVNVSVAYTFDKNLADEFKQEIEQEIENVKVLWTDPLSLSVSCHIGPNAVAVAISSVYEK